MTYKFSTEVEVEIDEDEIIDMALEIVKNWNYKERREIARELYSDAPTVEIVLDAFASLDTTRLEKAIQAIRDQSEHDLQRAIG
jgi:hypothetical protein